MSDLLEIFATDPLSYTTEAGQLRTILEEMRKRRGQFNLGNAKAWNKKAPSAKQAEVLKLTDKMDIDL